MIDVIVPIYGDYEKTRNCIESVLKYYNRNEERVILINDKSLSNTITKYLRKIKSDNTDILLLENTENLGFVGSVNMGMCLSEENDVILLNSDTVVTRGWVRKIKNTASLGGKVATVTPFSNSATIFSYPNFLENNDLPDGLNPETINSYFEKASNDKIIDVPTGVGFCMFVSRKSLKEVGLFDHKTFGKGYGEENDFCLRAAKRGFRNIACTNTFIYHADGASFGEGKAEKTGNAMKLLLKKHPTYTQEIVKFVGADPFLELRLKVDYLRLSASKRPGIVFVQHDLGGGVEKHVKEMCLEAILNGWNPFVLEPCGDGVMLSLGAKDIKRELVFSGPAWYKDLLNILGGLGIATVHFHHLMNLPKKLLNLPKELGADKFFTVHDYYLVCPRIFFLKNDLTFCEATLDESECDRCVSTPGGVSVLRAESKKFLDSCQKIIAPSKTAKCFYQKYFPDLAITVVSHVDYNWLGPNIGQNNKRIGKRIRVGVFGIIVPHKGSRVLEDCLNYTEKNKLPIDWFVLGRFDGKKRNVEITGGYNGYHDLRRLARKYAIDMVLLPSIAPETYSYTLSEAWDLRLPVMVGNIGAASERIRAVGGGWVVGYPYDSEEVCGKIVEIQTNPTEYDRVCGLIGTHNPSTSYPWGDVYGAAKRKDEGISKFGENQIETIGRITYRPTVELVQPKKCYQKVWALFDRKPLLYFKGFMVRTGFIDFLKAHVEN